MEITTLVGIIESEKGFRKINDKIHKEEPNEVLELYINEAQERYRPLTRTLLYGLKQGVDFELSHAQDFQKDTNLRDLKNYLGFYIHEHNGILAISRKHTASLSFKCFYPASISNSVLKDLLGEYFSSKKESEVREKAIQFLKDLGSINMTIIPRFGNNLSKGNLEAYVSKIVKLLSYGSGQEFIEWKLNGRTATLYKKRPKVAANLDAYFESGIAPGYFQLTKEHLNEIESLTEDQVKWINSNLAGNTLDPFEAAIMAKVSLINHDFRGMNHYLNRIGASAINYELKTHYTEEIKGRTKKAIDLVRLLEDLEVNPEEIISQIRGKDFYDSYLGKQERSAIQGTLGELFGLELLYILRSKNPIKILEGVESQKETHDEFGCILTYQKFGNNIIITNTRTSQTCELDMLALYEGIPIIFESKTGKKGTPYSSYESQKKFVSEMFGVSPIFVEIKFADSRVFETISPQRYKLTLPFKSYLIKETDRICNGLKSLLNPQ